MFVAVGFLSSADEMFEGGAKRSYSLERRFRKKKNPSEWISLRFDDHLQTCDVELFRLAFDVHSLRSAT